jgi:peptidoglycan hydrolase-like protein with peptidoglycan-binding domain
MWNRHRCAVLLALAVLATVLMPVPEVRADESLRLVQKKLQVLGFYKGKLDGSPGSMTNAAIRRFQLAHNLKVTGELNHQTLAKLGVDRAAAAPDYTAIGRFFAGGPFARAEANSQVETLRQVQQFLADAGLYAGPHNGLSSPTLVSSLKEWQAAQGITPSGRIDSATAAKMGLH